MRKERLSEAVVTYIVLILVSFIFFFPVLWLVLASFSASGSIYDYEGFFPKSYSLGTYIKLFSDTQMYDYPSWLRNTLFVAIFSCALSTVLVILTAYTMSRFRFKMRKPLMKTTLVLSMFPSFMGMTAVYLIMINFNLINISGASSWCIPPVLRWGILFRRAILILSVTLFMKQQG